MLEEVDLLLSGELLSVRILLLAILKLLVVVEVLAILDYSELGSCAVHSDLNVLAWLIAGSLDGVDDDLEGILDAVESGSEATFVTYSGGETTLLEELGEVVEYLSAPTNCLLEGRSTYRTNHELLESDRSIGVSATVDDVHHWHGESIGIAATDVTIERHAESLGSSLSYSEGNAEDGVGTEVRLGWSAVEGKHLLVDSTLLEYAAALESGSDDVVDVGNSLGCTLAEITALVAVAKLESLVLAGRCSRRNSCATQYTIFKHYVNLNGWIAT